MLKKPDELPANSVMAALMAEQVQPRALSAFVASSIVSSASSTCASRGAIAAAFDDLAAIADDGVVALLQGRTRELKKC